MEGAEIEAGAGLVGADLGTGAGGAVETGGKGQFGTVPLLQRRTWIGGAVGGFPGCLLVVFLSYRSSPIVTIKLP